MKDRVRLRRSSQVTLGRSHQVESGHALHAAYELPEVMTAGCCLFLVLLQVAVSSNSLPLLLSYRIGRPVATEVLVRVMSGMHHLTVTRRNVRPARA